MTKIFSAAFVFMLLAGLAAGQIGLIAAGFTAVAITIFFAYRQAAYIRIPELHVGVIYNTQKQTFSRFLPAGRYWLIPFVEQLHSLIDLTADSTSDVCRDVQTSSGIPVDIEWTLSFDLNPFRIPADKQAKLARSLPRKAAIIPKKHVNHCLRLLVGEMTIETLWQPGAQRRLERELRQMAGERLAAAGYELKRIMIGSVEMPAAVRKNLEAAQRRRMQAENDAQALARLQAAVSQFSDQDMARLLELERIHMLGQHGVALPLGMTAVSPTPVAATPIPDPTLWPPHRVTYN